MNSFFHSFCNLLINKGVKRSRFARYDSMQHHVYASHMYTYIGYRYRFFLWTLSFLKIWIHFLIPDVHLCNTSYYVGFGSCSCAHSTARNCTLQWKHGVFKTPAKNHPGRFPKKHQKPPFLTCGVVPFQKSVILRASNRDLAFLQSASFPRSFFHVCLLNYSYPTDGMPLIRSLKGAPLRSV